MKKFETIISIGTFPEDAEEPVVREVIRRNNVIWIAVYGDAPEKTLKYLAEKIMDDITSLKGVTLANLLGVRKGEIQIEISESVLCQYGLTLGHVADAVRKTSLDLPAGRIKTTGGEILVRTKGRRFHATDYSNVAILSRPDGSIVTLGEIARLNDGFEDVDLFARFQGKPAALIRVFRVADQNALAVVKQVKSYIERIRPGLPAGVKIGYFGDDSKYLPELKSRYAELSFSMEGEGKEQKEAMAVSLGFGVLFATFVTLLLIPCGYLVLEDMHNVLRAIKEKFTY